MDDKQMYSDLLEIEANSLDDDALTALDKIIIMDRRLATSIKTAGKVRKRLKDLAAEIMEELGVAEQVTEHGKAMWSGGGVQVNINRKGLDELAKADPDFAAKYGPYRTEKDRARFVLLR
jgi:hypothetical protein